MQPLPNNNIRNFPSEKKKGLVGAIIIHFILLFVLIFVGFKIPLPPESEEGIEVNFGIDETGFGFIQPATMAISTNTPITPRPSAPEEPLLTQNIEEAPEVRIVDPDAERRRQEQAEAERRRREELEAERRRIEAEQQRQIDIANNVRNAIAGSQNTGNESVSSGTSEGTGNQGSPTGSPNSNVTGQGSIGSGVSYDLGGRGYMGDLPMPQYNYQVDGIVIVEIRVDSEGRVTQATAGRPGSTTLNDNLLRIARESALKARFEPRPNAPIQVGTITYNFRLN